MLCPKCYGKIDKKQQRCQYCGFYMNQLDDASNKLAKQIKKTIYKDDILYSTRIPYDVSKKKLLLFAIFLGLFGVHDFYVGKFWQGLYICVSVSVTLILSIILMIMNTIYQNIIQTIFEIWSAFQGVALVMWFADIINISLERFKMFLSKNTIIPFCFRAFMFSSLKTTPPPVAIT